MLDKLLTEQVNPASKGIDAKPTAEILRIMNEEDQKVAPAVGAEIAQISKAVDAIVAAIRNGGRLFYAGAEQTPSVPYRCHDGVDCLRNLGYFSPDGRRNLLILLIHDPQDLGRRLGVNAFRGRIHLFCQQL